MLRMKISSNSKKTHRIPRWPFGDPPCGWSRMLRLRRHTFRSRNLPLLLRCHPFVLLRCLPFVLLRWLPFVRVSCGTAVTAVTAATGIFPLSLSILTSLFILTRAPLRIYLLSQTISHLSSGRKSCLCFPLGTLVVPFRPLLRMSLCLFLRSLTRGAYSTQLKRHSRGCMGGHRLSASRASVPKIAPQSAFLRELGCLIPVLRNALPPFVALFLEGDMCSSM